MARNCRDYCRFSKACKQIYPRIEGEEGLDPSDCPMAWKIEDLDMDTAWMRKLDKDNWEENESEEDNDETV